MQVRHRRIILAAATLLLFIAIAFPAGLAYRWFSPPALRLNGIEGSVWSGGATEGAANNVYLRNLKWRFRPLALFAGKIAFQTHGELAGGNVDAEIAVSPGGALTLSNLAGSLPLQAFRDSFQLQGFEGRLNVQFEQLKIAGGIPVEAIGSVAVEELLARELSSVPLGNFRAEFVTDENGISGTVEDQSGVLDVIGSISIGRDRSYSFVGQVAATAEAPPGLRQQLQYLGSADARGFRDFRIEGQL